MIILQMVRDVWAWCTKHPLITGSVVSVAIGANGMTELRERYRKA